MPTRARTSRAHTVDWYRKRVTDAPVSYSVYSSFSFFGRLHAGELPGMWLVSALGELGHSASAVRQTLYRMEQSDELHSRSRGRHKFYRLAPAAQAEADAGLAKIRRGSEEAWDGLWTLVQLHTQGDESISRERLRALLHTEGFVAIGAGVFIHPRDRTERLLAAARGHDALQILEVFRARRINEAHAHFVRTHWNIDQIAGDYESFIHEYQVPRRTAQRAIAADAFVMRFALVFDFLEVAWRDPELPLELLPSRWPGHRARELACALYDSLLPMAISRAEEILRDSR